MAKKAIATKGKSSPTARPVATDDDGFEILGGSSAEIAVGEMIEGVFGGVVRVMASTKKNMPDLPFYQIGARQVMGSTILRMRIDEGNVKPGDFLRVTRLEDAPKKGNRNPAKLFDVRVKRNS